MLSSLVPSFILVETELQNDSAFTLTSPILVYDPHHTERDGSHYAIMATQATWRNFPDMMYAPTSSLPPEAQVFFLTQEEIDHHSSSM